MSAATPYLNRAAMLGMDRLWVKLAAARVEDWFARIRARPSFDAAVSKWLTDVDRERFDIRRDEIWADIERVMSPREGRREGCESSLTIAPTGLQPFSPPFGGERVGVRGAACSGIHR